MASGQRGLHIDMKTCWGLLDEPAPEAGDTTKGLSAALVVVGCALCLVVAHGAQFVDQHEIASYVRSALFHGAIYLAGVWWVLQPNRRSGDLGLILMVAVVIRALAMSAEPNLTSDAYRYVWDGRIQLSGFNPYLHIPVDEKLAHLRDAEIFPNINQKERAVTIYPPFAEMIFAFGVWVYDGLASMKATMLAFEAVTVWALIAWMRADGLPAERVLIYAWHPLPIWEFASQAHIDSAATAMLVLGILAAVRGRQGLSGLAFSFAAMVKYFPVVVMPALWRRWDWRMPVVLVLGIAVLYIPYVLGAGTNIFGYLFQHLDNEGYGAGYGFHPIWLLRDFKLADPPGWTWVMFSLCVLGALAAWALFMRRPDEIKPERIALLGAAFVFFTSPHYPWYFAFLVALLVRVPHVALFAMTLLSVLLYYPHSSTLNWSQLYALVYYLPVILLVGVEGFRAWQRQVR